jgi:predicted aspartyl protease
MAKVVTISFQLNKRAPLIVATGRINSHGPIDFVIDTGASGTVVSQEVASKAGISSKGKKAKAAGADGSQTVAMGVVDVLELGELRMEKLKVAIMNFALLNRAARMNAGVILGYDFLRHYEFTVNYPARRISFKPLKPRKPVGSRKP